MANSTAKIARTATEALRILWEDGFFKAWRNWRAIEEYLAKCGNHFAVPELGMALNRAKHLTRKGKHGSFEYIQKHPFVSDAEPSKRKAKA